MAARTKATIFRRGALALSLLLIGVGSLMSAMALGGTQTFQTTTASASARWSASTKNVKKARSGVPSTTNPIAGECVAE